MAENYTNPEILETLQSPEFLERVEMDMKFVKERIDAALDAGRALDDFFIAELALERLEYAREHYSFGDREGAGPTLERSEKIVRAIMGIDFRFRPA